MCLWPLGLCYVDVRLRWQYGKLMVYKFLFIEHEQSEVFKWICCMHGWA